MCSRRNKPVFQAFVFLGLVGSLGYFVYLYNTITLKLDRSDRQLNKYVKHQKSLSAQLQVVYEHRARLEKSFEKEKLEHKKTKQELAESKRNFYINITRTRHETLNRFNSLETQHRMVKAKHEHLQLEYNRLQQQHARLSAEHVAVHNQQVNSFNAMKGQKENEILGLEAQIKTLKKQVATWKRQYVTEHDEAEYYKGLHEKALQDIENHKATILRLYERIKRRQPNAGTVLKDQTIPTFHESKPVGDKAKPHTHRVGNAGARPGYDHVTKATVFPVGHEVERKAEPVHEDVDTKTKKNINEEEEADDNDEDNDVTRKKVAQIPQTTQATNTPPPIYVPPQPSQASDVFRPDILKQREQETGDHKSRGSQDAPVILHDRSVRDSMPVALTATPRPFHPAVPKSRAKAGESEGEPKADSEGEEETEEQKVLKYLSRNAANAGNSQQQEQQQQRKQRQQQQQQQEEQQQQQRQQQQQQQQQQHQEEQQQQQQHQEEQQQQQQQEQEQRQQSQQQQQHQQPQQQPPQQQERHQQEQEQQSDSRTVDSPDRQVRDVHSEEEQQQESQDNTNQGPNIDLSRHQQYKQLNKPRQGLSKLGIRDSSKESNKNDKNSRPDDSNAEQKRLKREEQFRRPIPRPGGGDKRRTGEEDSEHIEPQGDENNRGKTPNVQEEENDNEEDDNGEAEKEDERDNTIDQKNNENQAIPRPDANKRANRAENTKEGEEEEEEESERQRRPNRGARLRGLRQA